ncbi:DUF4435 domain-containing protein [Aquitalea sp. ASV15]|uniref:DUF4435 domain-containing protein n=1 Tax=Aquitalea sp. ASV15 TaxID=2795104 RepID=UPI0018EE01AB|nr:DUF4435 domain-containing protein [Aquitalea sp. ASV15]
MANIIGLSTSQIKSRYRDKVEVYVEGKDDLAIYKNYWFSQLTDKLNFICAEEGGAAVPGCVGVERNVITQRLAGIDAYGLIDRDAVSDFIHASETNDISYLEKNYQKNPYIYYTVRWELENYLIDPDVWEQERVNAKTQGHNRREAMAVYEEILEHCQILVAHAAANVVRQIFGQPKIPDGFGSQAKSRAAYEKELFSTIMLDASEEQQIAYREWVSRIEAFDFPDGTPSDRVLAICRRIHGKALLLRFFKTYNIQDEKRFSVAYHLAGKVPRELSDKLLSWLG